MSSHKNSLNRYRWLIGLLLLYLLNYHGFTGSVIDETMPLAVTSQLVTAHSFQINPVYPALIAWGAPEADPAKPIYSKYALGQSLLMLPSYALGSLIPIHTLTHAPDGQPFLPTVPVLLTYLLGAIVTVLTAFGVQRTAEALGYSSQTGAWLGLLYGVTTFAWPYAKTLYSEPSTGCALIGALYWLIRYRQSSERRTGVLAGACFGLAILFRTSSLVYVPVGLLYCWPNDWRDFQALVNRWLWPSFGIAAGVIITAVYDAYRYGNPLATGYEPGFGRAPWEALLGYTLSPSRSLFLFAPILLLTIPGAIYCWRKMRREMLLIGGLAIVPLIIYSSWWAWDGGAALGPRFLLPSVSVAILLVTPLLEGDLAQRWRPLVIGPGLVGFGVQVLSNLPSVADVFGQVNAGNADLSPVNWQWDRSLLANFWPVYMQRGIDSAALRVLPIHNPIALAAIFAGLSALLIIGMVAWIARSNRYQ